jgi:hypothetical protein
MPKKWYSVHARTKEAQLYGIDTAEGHVNFNNKSTFNTSDERVVKALEAHKKDAYTHHDEQLSKAYDSGSWDVIDDHRGTRVKNLHNYTFTVTKIKPPTRWEKIKKFLLSHRLSWFLWYWNTINPNYKREVGIRFLGVEYVKEIE